MIKVSWSKKQAKNLFSHFYFLNKEISLNIKARLMQFYTHVKNIHIEGTVSQICDIGLSFNFMSKNG